MSANANELNLDINDLNNVLEHATRQRTKDVIGLEIRRLQTVLTNLAEESKTEAEKPVNTHNTSQKCYEVKLNNYGWDQTNATVKLYVTLKDVHNLPKEAVTCEFTEKSLDLRVFGLDNKNYHLSINNLCEAIDTEKSRFKVKTDMVVVSLTKKVSTEWSHVTGVEKRIKTSNASAVLDMDEDNADDSHAMLMNFMKKIYQAGNDPIKKTIAKAFTEAREKSGLPDF